jgi:hypothetical protein
MFVHRRVSKCVLLYQRRMIVFIRVFVARFVVSPRYAPQPTFESWPPATLTLVAVIQADDADKYRAFGEVSAKPAPKRVPLARLISGAGDLQNPVPHCNHCAP